MNKPARRVAKNTFEQPAPHKPTLGRYREDSNWDWRNPHDNPSGIQPVEQKPHKYRGNYNPDRYPSLDDEHDNKLFNPDLVDYLKGEYLQPGEWDKMSETEQIKTQIDFVSDCRHPMFQDDLGKHSIKKYEDWLTGRALHLQKQIKRKS